MMKERGTLRSCGRKKGWGGGKVRVESWIRRERPKSLVRGGGALANTGRDETPSRKSSLPKGGRELA